MKLLSVLLVVACVSATGCREYIVDPGLDVQSPTPEAAPPDAPSIQLKGPTRLTVGEEYLYKAGALEGARYEWVVTGASRLVGDASVSRFYTAVASSLGPATVQVYAFDITNNLIGYGSREVDVLNEAYAGD